MEVTQIADDRHIRESLACTARWQGVHGGVVGPTKTSASFHRLRLTTLQSLKLYVTWREALTFALALDSPRSQVESVLNHQYPIIGRGITARPYVTPSVTEKAILIPNLIAK